TDALATRFQDAGYELVHPDEPADVYVVNSCTVTNRADRKSRNLLNRAERRVGNAYAADTPSDQHGLVILAGCYVDSHRDQLESDGHTLVVPNEQKHAIFDLVEAHRRGEVLEPTGSVFDFPVPSRVFHTRTMIKVQDGCDNYCTFCIIPFVRGRAISRPATEVIDAVREAVNGGAREVVLTGVNMSRYRDGDVRFSELVQRVLDVDGDFRLRISSLEPDQLDDPFIDLFDHPKMSPHLHLCAQSASERILLAMRRQYTFSEFRTIAEKLRAKKTDFNLTTDIIAGFPGETDEEFDETLRAVDELEFGHVHTFPYSERDGTRAARMPGRIPERIRTERAAAVRDLAATVKTRYRRRLIGTSQRLLVERVEKAAGRLVLRGFGEHYVPIRVQRSTTSVPGVPTSVPSAPVQNEFVDVQIVGIGEGENPVLEAQLISSR
ncbi:MAG: tRNA (N(6)-L-threonylcarbamoyladenosine(37)-C(2))-methylthiotransferase MtaB, partial [Spirochaetaceae bacterium]|nr:tRNA (N(6)-L-threonylcarbamoyladenosine(37)-C(2))-methylthiotransferase MtaB [Spirochaetaceae bacterium]